MRDMQQCKEMRDYFWENGGKKIRFLNPVSEG